MIRSRVPRSARWIGATVIACLLAGCDEVSQAEAPATIDLNWTRQAELAGPSSGLESTGRLEPERAYTLRLGPFERVDELHVSERDSVAAGAVVARLADDALEARLVDLEAGRRTLLTQQGELSTTETEIAVAEEATARLHERVQQERAVDRQLTSLSKSSVVRELEEQTRQSEGRLRILRERARALRQGVGDASAELTTMDRRLGVTRAAQARLQVTAPFAGRVRRVHKHPQEARAGDTLLEIWDESAFVVIVELTQQQIRHVTEGDRAEVATEFQSDERLAATVVEIGSYLEPDRPGGFPRFPIRVRLLEPAPTLIPGMAVIARIYPKGPR